MIGRATTTESSAARERVLEAAERLFSERGYNAVTLRDIANELGMRQASLYHHAPGGKEALFVEVTERGLERHRVGMEQAIAGAGPLLRDQLRAAADWLLSQPPVDLSRMVHADMPAIGKDNAERLTLATYNALLSPLRRCFERAASHLRTPTPLPDLLGGSFVAVVELLHDVEIFARQPKQRMAYDMIDVLLEGALLRSDERT
ncbi:MAG: TetR/AcrR family transcriptional regulator [Roseiflexaceae bacterium]|nr:TetR/AcrR family transcriptional regulator [Roseiflexaceae bacterium]